MTHDEFLRYTSQDGLGTLTLNRPPLNVIHIAMLRELQAALGEAAAQPGLKALVVRAEGRLFSAGVDVADHTADRVGEMIPLFDRVCEALSDFPVPTLAVVHGHALGGGCELALSCDLIVAASSANFGQPEIKLATIAPVAITRLPAIVGPKRAAELVLTGEAIPATEAERLGLVNRAVPPDQLAATVADLTGKLSRLSAAALRLCKRALVITRPPGDGLRSLERLYLEELMATEDAHEGLRAFMEKRAPVWSDQ